MNIKKDIEVLGYHATILNILKRRDDNNEKRKQIEAQLREIDKENEDFYLNIDSVFEELKNNDPETYEAIQVKGRNTRRMKFTAGDQLYIVEQDLGYGLKSVVGCRIKIEIEELRKI